MKRGFGIALMVTALALGGCPADVSTDGGGSSGTGVQGPDAGALADAGSRSDGGTNAADGGATAADAGQNGTDAGSAGGDGGSGPDAGGMVADAGITHDGGSSASDAGASDAGLLADAGPAAVQPDFSLVDVNPASATAYQPVSPRDYLEKVSGWYFGHST